MLFRTMARLARDGTAGVTTLVALALPVVLGATGIAFDINRGFQQKVVNQRAADMGALAAAMAYKSSSNAAILTPTAQDVALANGLSGAAVAASLVSDFPVAGQQSVRVEVEETLPVTLGKVLGFSGTFTVGAQSIASLQGASGYAAPCYLALSGSANAIKVTGGASISAPTCAVAGVGSVVNEGSLIQGSEIISGSGDVSVTWGTMSAGKVRYAGNFSFPSWNGNVPPSADRLHETTTLGDPWASDTTRVAAMALLGTHATLPSLGDPATSGGSNWSFNWSPSGQVAGWRQGTSGNYIVPAGTYSVGRIDVAGGITVTFTSGSTIRVKNGFNNGGSSVNFNNTNLYVNGGFNSGSSGVTIGNGELHIGSGTVTFSGTNTKGDGNVIINATTALGGGQHLRMGTGNHSFRRLTVGGGGTAKLGAGNFTVLEGISISGDSELALGNGDIIIGSYSDGRALYLDGSARFFMGDGQYSSIGDIVTSGGSRLAFGKTPNHYLDGNVTIAGAVLFGKGRYTIDGNFNNGTGGTNWPYTSTLTGLTYGNTLEGVSVSGFDQAGIDVTFILAGTMNLGGGAKTKLEAATTTQVGGAIAELLLSSQSTAASNWNAGSNNRFAGTIHLPNSDVTMAGGNSTSGTKCMSLIASTITVSGGAGAGSACQMQQAMAAGSGSGTGIRLVQ